MNKQDVLNFVIELKNELSTYKAVAMRLGVNEATVWRAIHQGAASPHLKKQVMRYKGLWQMRHRRCAEFTEDRVWLFDEMLGHLGQTLTEWMNEELDIWLEDQKQSELLSKNET